MQKRLQVFVSSTYEDLRDERQAAVEAILRAGHIPAGMELFAAGDKSQMETITRWIDESDAYMLILGGRYGSIDPDSKKSYVQVEYEYALSINKPLFAVVISDKALERHRAGARAEVLVEQSHIKEYEDFRRLVLGKTSRFFEDPKDIRVAVFETLGDFLRNREFKGGWVAAAEITQPKPLIDEISRLTEESQKLHAELEQTRKKLKVAEGDASPIDDATMMQTLRHTEIDIPPGLTPDKKTTGLKVDLLSLFVHNADIFVAGGVNNRFGMDAGQELLYFQVAPKLATFGLVKRQKAAGGKHQEFVTTPAGNRLLAARRVAEAKASAHAPGEAKVVPKDQQPSSMKRTRRLQPKKSQ